MKVSSYRPQAVVTFFTEKGELVARATNDPKAPVDNDVISITTSRDIQADAPTFSIELVHRNPWHKWVASNDLIVIQMCRPPEVLQSVFIGLVDDCRKKVGMADNGVQRVISVTGRGLAKAFVRFDVGVVPEAEYQSTSVGWLEQAGVTLAGSTPATIIRAIWDKICVPHISYKWGNSKTLFDYTQLDLKDRPGVALLDSSTIMNWHGSVHALVKDVAEEPFYEAFWDVIGGKAKFIVRPTPFNPTDWNALVTYSITDEDVVSDSIGRSDVETHTIYSVGAKTLFSPQDTYKTFGVLPYWYKPYADKYGNNRLHVETSYMSVASSEDVPLQTDSMRELMVDLYNWNIKNNSMSNGTIVVKGSNYRVGSKLVYTSDENGTTDEFYITSVSHNFVNFGIYTTTLGVTRGMPAKERFTTPWGKYTEYSGLGILPFDPAGARDAMDIDNSGASTGIDFVSSSKIVNGARDIMNNGINRIMVKYTFGGNDPFRGKLDCSSFTQYVFRIYGGIDIGRTTGQQVQKGSKLDIGQLQPGDLVFFKGTYASGHIYGVSHVGIYIGNNQFIHNSSTKNVTIGDLNNSYFKEHWLMGRRVISASSPSGGTGGGLTGSGTTFEATAYGATAENLMGGPGWIPTFKTATGTTPKEGRTVAVDRTVIPLHSLLRIESDYPGITGDNYIAEDVGGAIKGNKIDIYFNDLPPADARAAGRRMRDFGRRKVKVTVLRRGKG